MRTPGGRATIAMRVVLGAACTSGVAHGIMRRDDVPDAEYVVAAEDYPAVVDLLEPGDCLGTLVAPSWVVTAAHCAEDLKLPHTLRIAGTEHDVLGVVCEHQYDGDVNDIALVHVDPPVTTVAPVPIYRDRDELGQVVTFVGRGDSGTGLDGQRGAVFDGKTRHATNVVDDVSKRWIEFVFESPGAPGATPLEGISGDGDSGGPAFVETADGPRVVGVSSWQAGREKNIGLYGAREFYTRVSSHVELVDATTGPDWDATYRRCVVKCALTPDPTRGGADLVATWLTFAFAACVRRARRVSRLRAAPSRAS